MSMFLKKNKTIFLVIGVGLVAFLLGYFGNSLFSTTDDSLSGAAGALVSQAECDMSPLSSSNPTGIVLADPLNFRTGPGLNYHVMTVLDFCTPVGLKGRTSDSSWLEIETAEGVGGWVYSAYIQANINKSSLKVTTGAGGPVTSSSGGKSSVTVTIQANQAIAYVNGMPANTAISATLSPTSSSGKALVVASGQTDGQGNITLIFLMPATWADGSTVTSGNMTLELTGGGASMTAWITYYTN